MKCDQLKENIYLYDHLSSEDKESVDHHIAQCDQCALLFEQLQEQQAMITVASLWKEEPTDPKALTRGIMNSIEPPSQVSLIDMIFHQFYSAPVRYVMGSLSFVLIVFFVYEFNQGVQRTKDQIAIDGTSTVLNSGKTMQKLRIKKDEPKILSLYNCLKQCGDPDHGKLCEGCIDRFNKLKRNHEDS